MGVSSIEEVQSTCCLSPKIYQPADDMDGLEAPRKKKMFSSSSFYEEPNAVYPTIEEQVQLCRKIAESLSDDCNVKSKGANMFFKRVKRAEKWIVAESQKEEEPTTTEITNPAEMPFVRPNRDGPPRLKLLLDPRQIIDMQSLLREGVDIVKHTAIGPERCQDIVKDLNSPTGRGAALFAKRKKKSEEWVVDDEKVRNLLQIRSQGEYVFPEPSVPTLSSDINTQIIAETVIRAAESKVMTYPNAVPQVPVIESFGGSDWINSQQQSAAYKLTAPKGWASNASAPSLPKIPEVPSQPMNTAPETNALTSLPRYSPLVRSKSFNNFNSSPRAWNSGMSDQFRPAVIKSVKPPSLLVL